MHYPPVANPPSVKLRGEDDDFDFNFDFDFEIEIEIKLDRNRNRLETEIEIENFGTCHWSSEHSVWFSTSEIWFYFEMLVHGLVFKF